ncbi:MAG: hypothetical protein PUC18_13110 [Prevotellaceae bacterium]|nr:hypothetical protein [Prevotellaceae bacterium]
MKKQVTIEQFRKVLAEEIKYATPEKVKVNYCTPMFLGGYKRDTSDKFGADIEEIIAGVSSHSNGSITIVKTDSAYDGDFGPYTLFIDILV